MGYIRFQKRLFVNFGVNNNNGSDNDNDNDKFDVISFGCNNAFADALSNFCFRFELRVGMCQILS